MLILAGCAGGWEPRGLPVQAAGAQKDAAHAVLGRPIIPEQSQYVMIPFTVESNKDKQGGWGFGSDFISGSYSGGSYSSAGFGSFMGVRSVHWHNVIFYDKASGSCTLLLSTRAVISSFYWPQKRANGEPAQVDYLLFGVSDRDTNGDGFINGKDAVVLWMTNLAGRSPTRLTPEDAHAEEIDSDDGGRSLYIRVANDSDGDRQFTDRDERTLLRVDTAAPGLGTQMVSQEVQKQAADVITQ